ncbi:ImcF-related family protein [Legionella yabuuchiae]|uniref:ImcF-related family protein n=1 Tax=Legionella yabuuchiae TaxID=376727 RepID=UPI001055ED9F|nr:ImcF-related family protein [Legionella yabuuchiae]
MKYYVQLIKGMKPQKKLILFSLVLLFFLIILGFLTKSLFRLGGIILGLSSVASLVYGGWYLFKYGKPHWLHNVELVFRNHWHEIKTFNWQKHLRRKASKANIPWHLMIGPPSSGKTKLLHALEHSSQNVKSQDLDTKRYYEQCYCSDGVLIDVSGSILYDEERWPWLITELKKTKIKPKLKGIVLVVSAQTLFEEGNLRKKVFSQLDKFYKALTIKLPIHLVITQCDRLGGFRPCFETLGSDLKKQVFGITFDQNKCRALQLKQWGESIYGGIYARCFKQLSLQSYVIETTELLSFPLNFKRLSNALHAFVHELSQDSIYQEKINFAGCYLVGDQHKSSESQGYFAHDLMTKQLFNVNVPVELSNHQKKRKQWIYRIKRTLVTLMFVSSLGLMVSAYLTHATLLHRGKAIAQSGLQALDHPMHSFDLTMLYPIAQHIYDLRHFKESNTWYKTLGINQVKSQLDPYDQILAQGLHLVYRSIKQHLAKELQAFHEQWVNASDEDRFAMRGSYYTQLKLYLMLNFPQQIDLDVATKTFATNWKRLKDFPESTLAMSKSRLFHLSQNYLEYLKQLDAHERKKLATYNRQLIGFARHDLKTTSGVSNVYAEIEQYFINSLGYFKEDVVFGDDEAHLWQMGYPLPRFFSRDAFDKAVRRSIVDHARRDAKHDWVIHAPLNQLVMATSPIQSLNDKRSAEQLINELHTLYFQQYIKHWMNFLTSLKIIPFKSYDEAALQLSMLEQETGSIVHLFQTINANFALNSFLPETDISALPSSIKTKMMFWFEVTRTNMTSNPILGQYLKQLEKLQQETERLSIGPELSQAAEKYVARLLGGEGQETELYNTSILIEQLMNRVSNLPERRVLKNILISPVQECYRALVYESLRGLQSEWKKTVLTPFKEQLATSFPFSHSGQDANLGLFINFFRPDQGIVTEFKQRLQTMLHREGGHYIAKQWLGVSIPFSKPFLRNIEIIEQLTQSLFPQGQGDLALRFLVYPIPSAGVKEILFVSNGQSFPYHNGPQEWVTFKWPSSDAIDHESFIRITQSNNTMLMSKEFIGPWGFFHLLHSAASKLKHEQGYRLQWTLNHEGRSKTVQLLIGGKSSLDAFELLLFKPLKLEESLT